MDVKMKNLVKGLILAGVFVAGMFAGSKFIKPVEKEVGIEYVWYQKGDIQELDGYYLEDGDTVVELTDGSWALYNPEKNLYIFQPVDLGDWDYEVENAEKLENIIKTYLSMKNNGWF